MDEEYHMAQTNLTGKVVLGYTVGEPAAAPPTASGCAAPSS